VTDLPQVLAIRYGTRTAVKSTVYLNYFLYDEADGDIVMDYFFWLVRLPGSTWLVDCGFSAEAGEKRGRATLVDPVEALAELGVTPADLDGVIVSHAHYDHVGNLDRLPGVPLVMAGAELEFWSSDVAGREQFAHSAESAEIELLRQRHAAGEVTLVSGEHEVVPGLVVHEVGGHTPGQLVVTVDTPDGGVVLAADAVHYYEELERDRPFAMVADVPGMYLAFERLRELGGRPGWDVVAGHDPQVMERFGRRPAGLAEPLRSLVAVVSGPEELS
jgi:glyoxylase-like metal-dependent hydrolase (beta-lactamase superfamily II)